MINIKNCPLRHQNGNCLAVGGFCTAVGDEICSGLLNAYDHGKNDALKLLKEQEPRVITLDELTDIYVEFKGDTCPMRLNNFDLQKIIMYIEDGSCRLWTSRPTDRQRMVVKWDD